jgi:hypothetical protein
MARYSLLLLLCVGCASFEVSTPDGTTVSSSAYGRGCVAVDSLPDGTISVIVAQDGTSDWSLGRMFAWIGELASPVFGGGQGDGNGMDGPSPVHGCSQILEDTPAEAAPILEPVPLG